MTAKTPAKATVRRSVVTSSSMGIGSVATPPAISCAATMPTTPAVKAMVMNSSTSWPVTRARPAPNARRTAISWRRFMERARKRLATLRQTTSQRAPTTESSNALI